MKKIIQLGLAAILAFSGASMFQACTSAIADNPTTNNIGQPKKTLLVILDGWGIGDKSKSDVIYHTPTPYIDYLNANYPHAELQASGEYVGLPDGQMGNYVHCFMDGRDTDPRSGKGFIADLQKYMDEVGVGAIASIIGRYYAMDRDKHWDRIKLAYDLLVHGKGRQVSDMVEGVQSCYDSHTEEHKNTDEFMEPLVNSNVDGCIKEGDVVIFFNFRSDRAKELTIVLTQEDMTEQGMQIIPNLQYYCMTPYDDTFTGVHILFPKDNLQNTLGEYISSKGLKQLHIAETEKYAHVTSFINGGREEPFEGEDRILVNSPQVATYDLMPEMSALEVKDKLVEALKTCKYDWIVVNFANSDMVGHTGVYTAIETSVKTIDKCLNEVVETATKMGYETIITADHGNADHALNDDGTPNTTHSVNPVPFIYVTSNKNAKVQNGVLADVAPSILHIMGLQQPEEMTGKCLIDE